MEKLFLVEKLPSRYTEKQSFCETFPQSIVKHICIKHALQSSLEGFLLLVYYPHILHKDVDDPKETKAHLTEALDTSWKIVRGND